MRVSHVIFALVVMIGAPLDSVIAKEVARPALVDEGDFNLGSRVAVTLFAAMRDDNVIDELEGTAEAFRTMKVQTALGDWKLSVFYNGVMVGPRDPRVAELLDRWAARWPKSPTPVIMRAHVHLLEAMGAAALNKTSFRNDQARVIDAKKLEDVRQVLEQGREIGGNDPHWYVLMARVASMAGKSETEVLGVLMEGLARHPAYPALYEAGTDYYFANWPGDRVALERWARLIAAQAKSAGDEGAYARVYWHAFEVQYGRSVRRDTDLNWDRYKASMAAVLKDNASEFSLGRAALMSCAAGDRADTRQLFEQRLEPLPFYPFAGFEERDACLAWAMTPRWRIAAEQVADWVEPVVRFVVRVWQFLR